MEYGELQVYVTIVTDAVGQGLPTGVTGGVFLAGALGGREGGIRYFQLHVRGYDSVLQCVSCHFVSTQH